MPLQHRFTTANLLLAVLLISTSVFGQARQDPSANSAALRHAPEKGRSRIEMGRLSAITVASEFVYVGGRRFALTPTVEAEQLLFVDADATRKVRRLIWIQVEARSSADTGAYEYPNDATKTVGGLPLSVSARRYSTPPEPTSDRGSAFRIVEAAGYTIGDGASRLRLVYLPEQPARREVMVIYIETGGEVSDAPDVEPMLARALSAIRLEARALQGDVTGVAFVDANGNGARDSGERGLANVVVSNQDAVVATDASGQYRVPRGGTGVVFVSVPDGYRTVGAFWRRVDDASSSIDFPLAPVAPASEFTFVHASDTHLAPAVLGRAQQFRALAESLNPAFVIITGDLVRDALRVGETEATGYYDLFEREEAQFKQPLWTVPGNHEIFGIERDKSKVGATHPLYGRKMYHRYQGPDYYSFNFGGVHFVGLNTVDMDDQWYYGHVDSTQLAWLERDLAMVPQTMPVVTFNHIPFFSSFEGLNGYTDAPPAPTLITVDGKTVFRHTVSNARAVLAVLRKNRHVLALGGHIHASEKIVFEVDGLKTRFNQAAAIVGPNAGAGMSFASGFTLYTVRDGVIDEGRFVPLGLDKGK